ncbi:hypothetical protein ACFYT3_29070 [Nocardia amikacinitolerans]|uniref:hypothetical protein n=1 Tax=Nocardia amikacinitolerans TaxID=756689 RepID=UPI003686C8BE
MLDQSQVTSEASAPEARVMRASHPRRGRSVCAVSPSRPRESTPETALLAPNAARRLLVYAVGTDAAEKMELLRSIGAQGSALRPEAWVRVGR